MMAPQLEYHGVGAVVSHSYQAKISIFGCHINKIEKNCSPLFGQSLLIYFHSPLVVILGTHLGVLGLIIGQNYFDQKWLYVQNVPSSP